MNLDKYNYKIEKTKEGKETIEYLDLIVSFDIETSSFINNGEKHNIMYIWMMCIDGDVITGRTWDEFINTINSLVEHYKLNFYKRLIIWVHNLSYEFQYIRKFFEWENVFAREKREVMKALTTTGVEFRCSYILSGCNLEKVGDDLQTYKVKKLVGNLDYKLVRSSKTHLTTQELEYCYNDVIIVVNYIREQKELYKKLTRIPLTNTSRVRRLCKKECYSKKYYNDYKALMSELQINDYNEYNMMKHAFQGGFTHASWEKVGWTFKDVKSYDFTSSYPTVMISEYYPMSRGQKIKVSSIEEIEELSKRYCLIFNIRFYNIKDKIKYEHYISKSKCWECSEVKEDNGRVIEAKSITTTITNIDLNIIKDFYEWEKVEIGQCYIYKKMYLPKPFILSVLNLYEDKTTLKDVEGKELEYLLKKGMLNSTYGMSCMDVITKDIQYVNNEWVENESNKNEQIENYNNDNSRFLFYAWGVFITAYARRNLFLGIKNVGEDYIYSDTDSIKISNFENHLDFIERYNKWILTKLEKACNFHGIDKSKIYPTSKKGVVKPLGVWDDDGYYKEFKTMGAKRYMVRTQDNQIKITIAGLNKKQVSNYLTQQENPFTIFDDGMYITKEYSGKNAAFYIDNNFKGEYVDYLGNNFTYEEETGIYIETSDYCMGLSEVYRTLLNTRTKTYL